MKQLVYLLVFLFSISSCHNSTASVPELKFNGLKGNVKSLKEKEFDATEKFGEVVSGDLSEVIIYEFDKDGNIIKRGTYFRDGSCKDRFEAEYNNKGHIVSRTHAGVLGPSTERVVERRKNYVKWKTDIGTTNESYREIIDEGLTQYVKNGKGEVIFRFFHDKNGRVLEREEFFSGLNKSTRTEYKYDKNGLLLTETHYTNAKTDYILTFKYPSFDKKGNWITQYVYKNGEIDTVIKREIEYR